MSKPETQAKYVFNIIERLQNAREKTDSKFGYCRLDEKKENKYDSLNEEKKDSDYYYYRDYRTPLKIIEPIKFGSSNNEAKNYDYWSVKTSNFKSNETIRNEQILRHKNYIQTELAKQNLNQNLYMANSKPLLVKRKFDSFTPATTYNS